MMKRRPGKSASDSKTLDVHVMGFGAGESILLRLPDNKWGVVDCYTPSAQNVSSNLPLAFLKSKRVGELEFVCLTHPHQDHYRGMRQLIEHYPPRYFFLYPGLSKHQFPNFFAGLRRAASSRGLATPTELERLFEVLDKLERAGRTQVQEVMAKQSIYPWQQSAAGTELEIIAISPGGQPSKVFADKLDRFLAKLKQLPTNKYKVEFEANAVSIALAIKFGETCVVLGGDVEVDGWQLVLSQFHPTHIRAQAVKVSHHGSKNGYCAGLWKTFKSNQGHDSPVAIISPSHRHGLPDDIAMREIKRHTGALFSSCDPFGVPLDDQGDLAVIAPTFGVVSLQFRSSGTRVGINLAGDAQRL